MNAELELNQQKLGCPRCCCLIYQPFKAVKTKNAQSIELASIKKDQPVQKVEYFWTCKDMMVFENIGFTKQESGFKYLICADCDLGPLGYHDPSQEEKTFNIDVERVKHM